VDRETLEGRAIFATDGSLESDCAAFRRPDQGHRVSPWFRLPLKLHSVESARASDNTWAASEWDRNHDGPPTYVLGETGRSVNWRGRKPLCNKDFSESLTFCPVGRVSAFRRSQPCPDGFILPR
jgi:hypothetical protein